jgi:hypothetical protein
MRLQRTAAKHLTKTASLVQREAARANRDGGIVKLTP